MFIDLFVGEKLQNLLFVSLDLVYDWDQEYQRDKQRTGGSDK